MMYRSAAHLRSAVGAARGAVRQTTGMLTRLILVMPHHHLQPRMQALGVIVCAGFHVCACFGHAHPLGRHHRPVVLPTIREVDEDGDSDAEVKGDDGIPAPIFKVDNLRDAVASVDAIRIASRLCAWLLLWLPHRSFRRSRLLLTLWLFVMGAFAAQKSQSAHQPSRGT